MKILSYIMLSFFMLFSNVHAGKKWEEILESRKIFDTKNYEIIVNQYKIVHNGTSPKIADKEIKEIPIKENDESLVDISDEENLK